MADVRNADPGFSSRGGDATWYDGEQAATGEAAMSNAYPSFLQIRRGVAAAVLTALVVLATGPVRAERSPSEGESPGAWSNVPAGEILGAVVGVRAEIRPDARTANTLGLERDGSGVVIDADGLVLTIGYLILEATSAAIVTQAGETVPAAIVAYDYDSGFGLLRALKPLGIEPLRLGDSSLLEEGDPVLVVGHEGRQAAIAARVASRRTFAGYWEYLLEDAIFTVPPHPSFGGAALIGRNGRLLGIGSLYVNDALPGAVPVPGNMFVPISLLQPVFADLLEHGRPSTPSHPWLGVYTSEAHGRVFVTRTASGGPAEQAGLKTGDIIMGVGGKPVKTMAEFFRKVWAAGDAGAEVTIDLLPAGAKSLELKQIRVRSRDRYDWLKLRQAP